MITSSFWRERSVFVTGHTGFKGAWLALMLERLNARVTGYGLCPATSPSLYDLAGAGVALCDVRGDVRDAALLDGALRAADPDIVIHLATRPPRRADAGASVPERSARAEGDRAVVEAVQRAPYVQTALIVSPEARKTARAKARRVPGGARVLSVFCPDPVGGGDFAGATVAPASGLHVLDALYGLLLLAETACHRDGRISSDWAFASPDDATALGWSPLLSPAEAVESTAAWAVAFDAGVDMRAFTLDQIDRYLGQRVRLTPLLLESAGAPLRAVA